MATSGTPFSATAPAPSVTAPATTTVGGAGSTGQVGEWGIRSAIAPGPRPANGKWVLDMQVALLRPTFMWGAGYCDHSPVKRAAVLANLRTAATSDTDDGNRQAARAALRGIHYGITGPVLQAQYSASLAALEGMTAMAVHPRPPVWVHPIDGVSSWF
ncbi:hypothetical protein B484DRAFT_469817, partial [Ochromonadaceae sp. CCMP2298]